MIIFFLFITEIFKPFFIIVFFIFVETVIFSELPFFFAFEGVSFIAAVGSVEEGGVDEGEIFGNALQELDVVEIESAEKL